MITNYQVVLKGVGVGYLREDVAEKLAPLFKISIDEAYQMLDQHDLVVKSGVDFQAAVKYMEELESRGCECEVRPEAANSTDVAAAAQPSAVSLNERAERSESVQETSVSGTTSVAEESKWTVPKISERGKKFVIYGLVGSVLIASVGYGAFVVYEAREKRLVAEKENLALEKLASVKPSTFYAIKLETKYPAEKPDVLDWSKISAKSELLNQVLAALQSKDDTNLASFQFEFLSTIYPGGASYELPPGEGEAFSELHDLIEKQPGLALELAEASKRILSNQQIHKADRFGWYNFPDAWYELAMDMGSRRTLEAYVEAKKHERDYAALYELYGGGNEGIEDTLKAAEYFGLAVQSGNEEVLGVNGFGFKGIAGKGPQVASAARESLLFGPNSPPIGNPSDLLKACNESSIDIVDPINNVRGQHQASDDAVRKCKSAIFFNKNDDDIWYRYGFALASKAEWTMAKIAYARSAELGNPIAIAQFWWIDSQTNPERSIKMLQLEAKNGNPWGNYFLGEIYSGSFQEAFLDYKKSEQEYLKAINAGIIYANYELAVIYSVQRKYDLALKFCQQAAEKIPFASLMLGLVYESGEWGKKDLELAKKWLTKAADQGIEEAKTALARIDKNATAVSDRQVTDTPLVGDWSCQSSKTNGSSFSSFFKFTRDGRFFYTDPQSEMIGTYQTNGSNARVIMDQVATGGRVSSSRMKVNIDLTSSRPGQAKFDMTLERLGVVTSNNCVSSAVAEATPAPQVNVCDVNPDACAAIQGNSDIRSQLKAQKCEALRGMASDYELAKVGCL